MEDKERDMNEGKEGNLFEEMKKAHEKQIKEL